MATVLGPTFILPVTQTLTKLEKETENTKTLVN